MFFSLGSFLSSPLIFLMGFCFVHVAASLPVEAEMEEEEAPGDRGRPASPADLHRLWCWVCMEAGLDEHH